MLFFDEKTGKFYQEVKPVKQQQQQPTVQPSNPYQNTSTQPQVEANAFANWIKKQVTDQILAMQANAQQPQQQPQNQQTTPYQNLSQDAYLVQLYNAQMQSSQPQEQPVEEMLAEFLSPPVLDNNNNPTGGMI